MSRIKDTCRCEETDDVVRIAIRIQPGFMCDALKIGDDVSRWRCHQIRRVGRQAFPRPEQEDRTLSAFLDGLVRAGCRHVTKCWQREEKGLDASPPRSEDDIHEFLESSRLNSGQMSFLLFRQLALRLG